MIAVVDVQVNAANPAMPLFPMRAFQDSPSSIRIRNVPKKIGNWRITQVYFSAEYPDNTTTTVQCSLVGGVWVGTVIGSTQSGFVSNGYAIYADGVDENGDAVNGYVLGKGDITIYAKDRSISPGTKYQMYLLSAQSSNPKNGDVWQEDGKWYIWQDNQAWPLGQDSGSIDQLSSEISSLAIEVESQGSTIQDNSHSIMEINNALNEKADVSALTAKQDKLTTPQIAAIDSAVDERTTVVKYNDDTTSSFNIVGMLKYDSIPNISAISEIDIGNSVTCIGNGAFNGCFDLTSVSIPDSVTNISSFAFWSCSSLVDVTIPDSVTFVGGGAFQRCFSLSNVHIGTGLTSLGDTLFSACRSLSSVTIPYNITSLDYAAFNGCQSLTSIIIPNSVTSIGTTVFTNCHNLSSVTIPDSVTSIGYGAFEDCGALLNVTIPESVTSIGAIAFNECGSLTSITFKGKTLSEISAMANYPWGITDTSIITTWNDASQEWSKQNFLPLSGGEITTNGNTMEVGGWGVIFHNDATLTSWNGIHKLHVNIPTDTDFGSFIDNNTNTSLQAQLSAISAEARYSLLSSGSLQLEDRAVQHVSLELSATVFTLPQLISGKVNDFVLDVTNTYTEGGTPAAASFSLNGTIGTDFNIVVPKDESFAEMTTLEAGEMAEFYFTRTSFELGGLPTWKVVKQVVDQYTPTAI